VPTLVADVDPTLRETLEILGGLGEALAAMTSALAVASDRLAQLRERLDPDDDQRVFDELMADLERWKADPANAKDIAFRHNCSVAQRKRRQAEREKKERAARRKRPSP
jgi:hypothetical protein